MSKENMTMDEAYTCPRCGGQSVNVGAMEQIFSDARSEEITCMKCGSSWMVYYKMFDFNTKTLNITNTPIEDETNTDINEDEILNEVPDYHAVTDDGTEPEIETTENN